ncbi:MAG: topoisomerase DNA-binding C4 zinc finger domain-containing protein [Lachnospiraceae bacterium]|nr:topoisomerase DNA-binding C4 zinc finger domain-containing protein [Lachnospiraceae bacterium]
MLSDKAGKNLNTYVPDYVIFDLETTGVNCGTDQVIEISAVKVAGGLVVEEFSTLVNPGFHIPYPATMVNGITDDMVSDSPDFRQAFTDFLAFAGDAVLVGHNIRRFDLKFLYRDAEVFWGQTVGNDFIDTLDIAKAYLPEMKHHTLSDLAQRYGICTDGAHRALADCRMNQQVFEHLKEEMAHPSEAARAVKKCPKCGSLLKRRNGRYGEFWGCTGYPECRYTENISSGF